MSRKIFLPRPEVEKLSLTSSPCPLCEALGSASFSEGGDVTIEDSEFLSNSGPVIASKGKLKIKHANFTGNVSGRNGGALRVGSDATIEESDFYNNAAVNGGALFIGGNTSTISLRALKFYNNVAKQTGGAISFEKSQVPLDLTMQHITFQENRANSGGAITLERDFHNNLFANGGAVAFVRNEASDSGGAIFAPNARIQLSRGVFIGNRAGKVGGAIAALEENDHKVVLANSLLVRNSAPKGSAFWGNRASFVNSTIADNSGTTIWPQDIPFGSTLATTPFFNDTEVARPSFSVTPPRHLHDPKQPETTKPSSPSWCGGLFFYLRGIRCAFIASPRTAGHLREGTYEGTDRQFCQFQECWRDICCIS